MTIASHSSAMKAQEPAVVQEIADHLQQEDNYLIVGHLRPDGDCLGSCLGLMHLLHGMGKRARFFTYGPVPDFFRYLPGFEKIETDYPENHDGPVLCVDTAELDRAYDGFAPRGFIVNIDHHISNSNYGNINWVDGNATAAGEQIYRLAQVLEQPVTRDIAVCLYTALMTDTGGFRYSNTQEMTFLVASHLVQAGANPADIAEAVFDSRKPGAVKLTGEVYATLKYEYNGQFVWNEITREMYEAAGGEDAEPEGLSSDLRSIDGVEISILMFETADGFCRIGFRSRGKVNVSEMASLLGGGGHHNASGALVRLPYPEARDLALLTIRQYLDKNL